MMPTLEPPHVCVLHTQVPMNTKGHHEAGEERHHHHHHPSSHGKSVKVQKSAGRDLEPPRGVRWEILASLFAAAAAAAAAAKEKKRICKYQIVKWEAA